MRRKSNQKCFCYLTSVWTDPSFHRRYCYCTLPRLVYSPENLISLAETESQVEVKAFQFICSRGGKRQLKNFTGRLGSFAIGWPWLCCNSHQRGPTVSSAHFLSPSHQVHWIGWQYKKSQTNPRECCSICSLYFYPFLFVCLLKRPLS